MQHRGDEGISSDGDGADLRGQLQRIDGRPYPAYKDLGGGGSWGFRDFCLFFDRVQGDAYAPPTRCRLQIAGEVAQFPAWSYGPSESRRKALGDFLSRAFVAKARSYGADQKQGSGGGWGGAKGGDLKMERPGQNVLERTSVVVYPHGGVEARFTVGLPAQGRSIMGRVAAQILCDLLPNLVNSTLKFAALDAGAVKRHVELVEDQDALRGMLDPAGLVAFVPNGAVLARASGASDLPMDFAKAVKFQSTPEDLVSFTLPNRGEISGMGIRKGVTLIVGGGFHGKSTVLKALELGVYPKIPGDGRELVATVPSAVKVRAEDGRSISNVNISPFIGNLPFGKTTADFSTADASGSTSQAANIVEALEAGARALMIDEDTAATNFMIRDKRMQKLVSGDREPIRPFISKVRALYDSLGVSSILVIGGSGDYFEVADKVVMMEAYSPRDVTEAARQIAADSNYQAAESEPFGQQSARAPQPEVVRQFCGEKTKIQEIDAIWYGDLKDGDPEEINLKGLEQLVEKGQTRFIAETLKYLAKSGLLDGQRTVGALMEALTRELEQRGLDAVASHGEGLPGDFARPRAIEIIGALNRLRRLTCRQTAPR